MLDNAETKSKSKPKINIKGKSTKLKQKKNYSSLTPNKYQNPKGGITYNDKININNSTVFAPHHHNYNINNNISININIDMTNNKSKKLTKVKNKSQIKNRPIRLKKEGFKNTNSLIFNTLKNYTNKNNVKKSPFHIRIKSANIGSKDFKYNVNKSNNKMSKNNNSNNTNTAKNFNLTTNGINKKKEESNNANKTSLVPKNISIENIIIGDKNKNIETKKEFSVSLTNENLKHDKKLFKNKAGQNKKPQKNVIKKRSNFSPTINRELLNQKQNIILNYSINNKKNSNISLKKKNDSNPKDHSINIASLISKNQIINNNKKQIMNYKAKSPMNNNKFGAKNTKLNNTGKLRSMKIDFNLKNANANNTNKNFNKTNKSKNNTEKQELDEEKKRNTLNDKASSNKGNVINIEIKEKENQIKEDNNKNEEEIKKDEEKKEEKKSNEKQVEEEKKKEEELKKKEEQKKIEEEQKKKEEEQKKKEEQQKKKEEEQKKKEKDQKKKEEEQKQKQKKPENDKKVKHNKENGKSRTLNQSKSQNEISPDFIKKQLDNDKKVEDPNQNLIPTDPAIKKLLRMESICKKGFAGPGIKKTNQDNFFIYKNFLDSPENIFLGVCDGHGMYGQDVSGYLVNHLPQNLNNSLIKENIKSISSPKDFEKISSIVSLTFVQTNINLVNDDKVDSTFSGATCSSLLFCPEKIISANVGDSRCVLGKFDGKSWKAKNLTRDHKLNEEDEKKRIIEKGGRIEAYKDEEGDFVGPERVWLKGENLPGLAMSRSFGDDIAHSVGVVSQPEILEYKLLNEDKFIMLASDGIWEFISSDECVNIVKDYYLKDDIDGALNYLYKESSKRWIMEEEVIDDITLIIMFLN